MAVEESKRGDAILVSEAMNCLVQPNGLRINELHVNKDPYEITNASDADAWLLYAVGQNDKHLHKGILDGAVEGVWPERQFWDPRDRNLESPSKTSPDVLECTNFLYTDHHKLLREEGKFGVQAFSPWDANHYHQKEDFSFWFEKMGGTGPQEVKHQGWLH